MEELSQNELIGIVTLIRDKKEYQDIITKYGLINELHQIVHHSQSDKNKYHGKWSDETRSRVIHQVLNKIIEKEDREGLLNEHPLLLKISEMKRSLKETSNLNDKYALQSTGNERKIARLRKHIENIEKIEKIETKELQTLTKREKDRVKNEKDYIEREKDYIEREKDYQCLITHYEQNFVIPLLQAGWIHQDDAVPITFNKSIPENIRKQHRDNGLMEIIQWTLPHISYFKNIEQTSIQRGGMNLKYIDKIKELKKEIDRLQ
jgi:hypothetical protein